MHRRIKLNRKRAIAISLIILAIGLSLVHILVQHDAEHNFTRLKSLITLSASDVRNRIEYQVHSNLSLMLGSLAYVSSHPDISQEEFAKIAANIMRDRPFVMNLGLAKNNIITHLYPLENNRAALGLHYFDNEEQKPAVLRAIESKQAVLAGPLHLKQGGIGLINRIPIFLDNNEHSYWGIASVVIKLDAFYENVGIDQFKNKLRIALRGTDGLGAKGAVFYGDPAMFKDRRNVRINIPLPGGKWQLAAAPAQGWTSNKQQRHMQAQYVTGFGVCLVLTGLLYFLLLTNVHLNREKNKAINAVEQKNRFFTYMTHELRTPLTSIFGVVRMLEEMNFKESGTSAKPLLANAHRNCDRLMHLINDILDQRKLEMGHMTYYMEPSLVSSFVDEAMDEMQQYAEQFDIHLRLSKAIDPELQVMADGKRLSQVLVNLLANAIKFSPPKSEVDISVKSQGDTVCISISDKGPGIKDEVQQNIFKEFVQAEHVEPTHRIPHGTGLGLSISKKLAEDHKGSLRFFNNAAGGAVFHLMLPKYLNSNDNYQAEQRQAG